LRYFVIPATMNISFENPKHERLANDFEALSKKYDKKGQKAAGEIIATLDALKIADSLFDLPPVLRPHPLKVEYKGCFAVDVTRTHRIIFKPNHPNDPNYRIDNPKTIKSIIIIEIYKDYH
jgi:mRNA-degrading endonuclease YafQ of YafQ-DinJ toxin-antitoxin module